MRKLACILLSSLLAMLPSAAGVTLQECRRMARDNYPLVRKYDLIQITRDCNVHNASLSWIPRLEIGGRMSWQNYVTEGKDLGDLLGEMGKQMELSDKREQPWQYQVSAVVTQNIWDGGASSLKKKTAEAEASRNLAELEVSMRSLENQVDEVFFSTLLLEERRKQALGRYDVLESDLNKMKKLYGEGAVSAMELKLIEAEVLSVQQELEIIEVNIATSRLSLSLLTSKDMSAEQLVIPREPDPAEFRPKPEYELIERNRKLLELNLKKLDVALSPKIGLFADTYYGYPNLNMFSNLVSSDPRFNVRVGLQFSFNLYNLYTRKNDRTLIKQQLKQLDVQSDILDFNTRMNGAGISQEMVLLRKSIDRDSEILELRKDIRIAAEEKMDNGVTDASDLLRKINEESDASLQKSIHRIEFLKALYRQEQNGPLSEVRPVIQK